MIEGGTYWPIIESAMGKEALREAEVPSDHEEEDYYAEEEREAAE